VASSAPADRSVVVRGKPVRLTLVLFDRQREILLSMAENVERATPEQLEELIAHLVERVETAERKVTAVVWTPPARPFFATAETSTDEAGALFWCPQGAVRAHEQRGDDALAWYASAA
jgi:hypothetical protein